MRCLLISPIALVDAHGKDKMVNTAEPRSTYHHGNLRQAVIDATLCLVEEGGFENVNLREVARRAGVSTGAPFRHFSNKMALMTAVAEEAMELFRKEIDAELKELSDPTPMARFRAIGQAYLHWAIRYPTHFKVVSAPTHIDFAGSESLRRDNAEIRALMTGISATDQFGGRALVFGLARLYVSGNFTQWGLSKSAAKQALTTILDSFIAGLERVHSESDTPAAMSETKNKNKNTVRHKTAAIKSPKPIS